MPSTSLSQWQTDRAARLTDVEAHCVAVLAHMPANPSFIDESLRGYVLHLSAHFQGFCRDLYTECCFAWVAALPAVIHSSAMAQCFTQIALEKGNPSYDNIKKDFSRFGLIIDLQTTFVGQQQVTSLSHLNEWRNKAAHQGVRPLSGGVPAVLSVPTIHDWRLACNGIAVELDRMMHAELTHILGVTPW